MIQDNVFVSDFDKYTGYVKVYELVYISIMNLE